MTSSRIFNKILEIALALTTGMPAGHWWIMHLEGHHVQHKTGNEGSFEPKYCLESKADRDFFLVDTKQQGTLQGLCYVITRLPKQFWLPLWQLMKWSVSPDREKQIFALWHLLDYLAIASFVSLSGLYFGWQTSAMIVVVYVLVYAISTYVDFYTHAQGKVDFKGQVRFSNVCRNKFFNWLLYNFGYHVAHHMFPWLHWSKLPEAEREKRVKPSKFVACRILLFFLIPIYWYIPEIEDSPVE